MEKNVWRLVVAVLLLSFCLNARAQTETFTYQGSLKVNGVPANGVYEAQFALFDSLAGGTLLTQLSGTITAVNGVFTANLLFGSQFTGASRFLEIRFRPTGSGDPFTTLAPRQQIFSAPYAIRSIEATNAARLGGVAASQYVLTGDARLSDARQPLPGSGNYINNTSALQPASNFNISGTGSANIFNAETQYNIGGGRFASSPGGSNTFVGAASGANNSTGSGNSFFGFGSGTATTNGSNNSYFGFNAGQQNSSGVNNAAFGFEAGRTNTASNNSFFGFQSGIANTTGTGNSFFGSISGGENTIGADNSFFGVNTGRGNTTGNRNSFFGRLAGRFTTTGDDNTFAGYNAGNNNTTGGANTALGANANLTDGVTNATAVGFRAFAAQSNSLILGSINGVNGASANTRVGIGTTTPSAKLTVSGAGIFSNSNAARIDLVNTAFGGGFAQQVNDAGEWVLATTGGTRRLTVSAVGVLFSEMNIVSARDIIAESFMSVGSLSGGGSQSVCRELSLGFLAACSSSLRYKTNVNSFAGGLDLIRKLRPVTFNWKSDNTEDMGLVAEEVATIEPLLTTTNGKGEIEGVKYDRLGVVLVNAVNEQQTEIDKLEKKLGEQTEIINRQKELLQRQQTEIDALKQFVCAQSPALPLCRPRN